MHKLHFNTLEIVVMYWIFSAVVGSLETPETTSSKLYKFFFRFLHSIAGNINRAAVQFKLPGAAQNGDVK